MKKIRSNTLHLECGVLTDKGMVRSSNEDSYIADNPNFVFVIADGMGGHAAGEIASRIAADTVQKIMTDRSGATNMETQLQLAVYQANTQVYQTQKVTPEYKGMGSTLTVLTFQDDRYYLAQVGDSRAYLFRDKLLRQLSRDHSLVWPLFEKGVLSKDALARHPQKHLITRCIGTHPEVEVDLYQDTTRIGDMYILCSDGLTDVLTDGDIEAILHDTGNKPQKICQKLVHAANLGGGRDNITVLAVYLKA
jgi:PPM family protein phosphatase